MRIVVAKRFYAPTKRGLIRPFLVEADDLDGGRLTLVVKSQAGYQNHGELRHMHIEAFCLLLARELGVDAAEPVAVELQKGFEYGALDFRDHEGTDYYALIERSIGTNLATIHLGEDWKPWVTGSPPEKISQQTIQNAFAFDAVVQNDDRDPTNPNLLWRRDRLALLDFDRAWCLGDFPAQEKPWRSALPRLELKRSCLFSSLQLPESANIGGELLETIQLQDLREASQRCIDELAQAFPVSNLDFQKIHPYLTKLASQPIDFFQTLTHLVAP